MTLGARVRAHGRLKLGLALLLGAGFWTGYSYLGRHAFVPVRTLPLTAIDRAIPFHPAGWAWVYLSQFLLTGFLPWLLASRDEIRRYVASFVLLSGFAFAIFILFPVASPRPVPTPEAGAMRFILAYDGTLNAFPSLHAGFLVLMVLLAPRIFGTQRAGWLWAAGLVWGGAILYATIATRQHYAVDLAAGAALGALVHGLAWRTAPAAAVAATMRRS